MTDDESRLRQQQRWERAITCSVLAIIATGIIGMAAQDAFFHKPIRRRSMACECIGNLKAMDGAKATWALEFKKRSEAVPTDAELFGATNYIREKPACPGGGRYTLGNLAKKPRCSIPGHTI